MSGETGTMMMSMASGRVQRVKHDNRKSKRSKNTSDNVLTVEELVDQIKTKSNMHNNMLT